ncbi:restriction endonuclease subunit S [Citrobacter sp. FDAARGOS_156]|uniref:restriction endonuclease subunit S n=1 Tax=Citrobacter sp. FDAARGOS_156 TaxID=1702170 RepID=UPI00076B3B7B|nr:restriction endonuclease subunit S [Citrobacter sp. FDAARGOS_156]AMH13151.1 restriction endonuclease subunit S [Citrobacter sp. FDAARGOS_156]
MGSKWKTVRLGDYCIKIGSGATPKGGNSVYTDTGNTYFIRSQNVYNDGFNTNGLVFITDEAAFKLKNVDVQESDVLLNITGDSVARVCIAPRAFLPARVNQHVAIIRPKNDAFDPRFLRYYLSSPYQQALLLTLASAGATRNALTKGMIEDLQVPKPPLHTQISIANVLESFDKKIESSNKINQTLEQMSQTLFKSWFVDFDPVIDNALDAGNPIPEALQSRAELRQKVRNSADFKPLPADIRALFPSEFEETELGWVPKAWCFKNLSSVYLCLDSKRIPLSKQERCQKQPGNIPYYGATSVMDYINEYIFDDILLLVGEDGSVIKDDNTPFIQYIWGKSWVNNHAHVLKGKDKISTEQLMLFMSQCNVSAFVTGAVQMKINQKNMGSIQFLKAPDNINTAFNEIIIPFFQKMRATKEQLSDLINLRDTLLPKLISGELSLEDLPNLVAQTEPA